jgi:pSer/pThr/pTyr-binding forkhead associated (FHA) protein
LLERIGGQWAVVDDGISTNGSFVNGSRVGGRQPLHDRDRLCFGQTILVFREPPEEGRTESTARASRTSTPVTLTETQRKILIALCRPVAESRTALPATNRRIADELFLSVDAVKAHLRALFERFGLEELPQNEKRVRLAARALDDGLLRPHDF